MKTVDSRQSSVISHRKGLRQGVAALFMLFAICFVFLPGQASAKLTIKANHDRMSIDFFYHGSTVSVSGVSDPGTEIVYTITSPEGHESLKRKGKVGGVLWMNVGDLKLERTPKMYLLGSSKKLDEILSPEEINKYVLGYRALKDHMEISPVADDAERTEWFNQFVKYKEASKLYSVAEGNVSLQEKDGNPSYVSKLDWPYQATPGAYTVTVYAVKDRKVVDTARADIAVEQVGTVKTLAHMAKDDGALYGGISIFAALLAGFGVGMIFRKGGGSH